MVLFLDTSPIGVWKDEWEVVPKASHNAEKVLLIQHIEDRKRLAVIKINPTQSNSADIVRELTIMKSLKGTRVNYPIEHH